MSNVRVAKVKIAIFIMGFLFPVLANAVGWGTFSGYNTQKQLITLSPNYNEPSQLNKDVEDIYAVVYIGTPKSQFKSELKEVCHQYNNSEVNSPRKIWCDGNKKSPLYGVTYTWNKTIHGVCERDYCDDTEIWLCASGCNSRAPKELLYVY